MAIKDSNPSSDPVIQPNYLKEELDMKLLRAGCKKAMELLDKPALKEIVGQVTSLIVFQHRICCLPPLHGR